MSTASTSHCWVIIHSTQCAWPRLAATISGVWPPALRLLPSWAAKGLAMSSPASTKRRIHSRFPIWHASLKVAGGVGLGVRGALGGGFSTEVFGADAPVPLRPSSLLSLLRFCSAARARRPTSRMIPVPVALLGPSSSRPLTPARGSSLLPAGSIAARVSSTFASSRSLLFSTSSWASHPGRDSGSSLVAWLPGADRIASASSPHHVCATFALPSLRARR
mmetsp:Transcript_33944/g.66260  ORF Transcript_33944/g.66260 Transcript_33944/m.66260 type:complete len:220 (+) Transcript_33944:1273-1932(+)